MSAPRLSIAGVSHKTAQVELRERLAFRTEALPEALNSVRKLPGCLEAAILSTCNRVEIYAAFEASAPAEALEHFLSNFHQVPPGELGHALYSLHGQAAVQHLFEVAASLDSLIIGESEILAQAREAYRKAGELGHVGANLRGLFERAFFLAKELRSTGGLGQVKASVSSAAVTLAEKIFENLKGHRALVVGTGEMASGIVRALKAAGVVELFVASRTQERAEEFAKAEGGTACRMQDLELHLQRVDIALVSAAAPHFVLTPEQVSAAQTKRRGRPLFVIDISVPRMVDPAVDALSDVFLYNIDHLESVAEEGRRQREEIAREWKPRLAREAEIFIQQLGAPATGEIARQLIEAAAKIRAEEAAALAEALRDPALKPEHREKIAARSMERLQNRLLHPPLAALKEAARNGEGPVAARWTAKLFGLEASADASRGSAEPAPQDAPEKRPASDGNSATTSSAAVPESEPRLKPA